MATKQQALRALAQRGLELDTHNTGRIGRQWYTTIDAIGRNALDGDCRGEALYDYTATADQWWERVIERAKILAVSPCPCAPGECEFHDDGGEES